MSGPFNGRGIGVTRGIAIGEAHLLLRGRLEAAPRFIDRADVSAEVARFHQAVALAKRQLQALRQKIPAATRSDIATFIDTHLLMLDDAVLTQVPVDHIQDRLCGADWALQLQRDALARVFDAMEDPYLRCRKDDIDHVVNQIQKILLKEEEEASAGDLQGKIILTQDLTPADTILISHQGIAAFVTEFGGPMSHTAILARSLSIPAVVGVHHATRYLRHGELLIVDGEQGLVLASPDQQTLSHYRKRIDASHQRRVELRSLIGQPVVTTDGETASLMANIELPEDIDATHSLKADGVGLFRTEYLYMNRAGAPDEEEHYAAYRLVVDGLDGIPVTIRTLDLGADKQTDGSCFRETTACNPALGLRAIRLCLRETGLFMPQLRAILRASARGPVRMMIPMLSNLDEVLELKGLVAKAKKSLIRDGLPFDDTIPVGGMIEVPAAALAANAFARELDFLSIGTNDLIQYTLAIDRIDDEVNYLYDPLHPSVLYLIQRVIDAGLRLDTPVSMCGEMAGDPRYIPLLLGMGLRVFSMQPGSLLEAKRTIRMLDAGRLSRQVHDLMQRIDEPGVVERLSQLADNPVSW